MDEMPTSRVWLHALLVAICCLAADGTDAASAPRSVAIEVDVQTKEMLAKLACEGTAAAVVARRHLEPPPGEFAEVRCQGHPSADGLAVAKIVNCARIDATQPWTCDPAIPTVTLSADDGRRLLIRYVDASAQDALNAVTYLLSKPSLHAVQVHPDWIAADVWVYRTEDVFLVTSGKHAFRVTKAPKQSNERFDLREISVCENDLCYPLLPTAMTILPKWLAASR